MKSRSSILAPSHAVPAVLAPARLAEVLAILLVDIVEALDVRERHAALEGLANRLDAQGRTQGGSEAAAMLGAVGAALMRLGA